MLSIYKYLRSSAILAALLALVISGCGGAPKAEEPTDSSAVVQQDTTEEAQAEPEATEDTEETTEVVEDAGDTGKSNHVVQRGESLWEISEYGDVYNDPFQWPVIYKANRDQIKDPDLIYPNQNFAIPRDASDQEIADAVHEAKTRGPWSLWDGK